MARITRNRLARHRVDAGFDTAQQAAEKLGCTRVYLLNIERGATGASPALIQRIAALYGLSEDQVIFAMRLAQKDLHKRSLEALQ